MARKVEREQTTLRDHETLVLRAAAELPPVCAAVGQDDYLRSRALAAFRRAWLAAHPAGDVVAIRGAGEAKPARLPDVTREFAGGSLFTKDKLVTVRQADRVLFPGAGAASESRATDAGDEKSAAKPGNWEKNFLERIDSPPAGAWLFLELPSLPKNRTLGKRLAAAAFTIPCPKATAREIPAFLRARAREGGFGLDDAAADLLLRAHGTELGVLAAEIDKLGLFAPEGSDIDRAMVKEFLTGSVEYDIFAFTNAVESRDAGAAAYYSRRITSQGARDQRGKREDGEKTSHKALAMLASSVTLMLRAKVSAARRESADDFARAESLSPWRGARIFESAGQYSLRELRRMAAFMADQVRRTHDTGGDAQLALETTATVLTRGF